MKDPHKGIKVRPHPAKFSDSILDVIAPLVSDCLWIADPMAGVGKITRLRDRGYTGKVFCNELEAEWSCQIVGADSVTTGDALHYRIPHRNKPGAIVTSPPYGNRMSISFETDRDGGMKGRYAGDLGRELTTGSTACLPFGSLYMDMMREIYTKLISQLPAGSVVILNVSNFIRVFREMRVESFFIEVMHGCGLVLEQAIPVVTPRRTSGANSTHRVSREMIFVFRQPLRFT